MKLPLVIATAIITFSPVLSAQTVNWAPSFQFGSSNTQIFLSDGTPVDSSFTWEVGAFGNGFVPTLENIGDWSDNWISLATDHLDSGIPWSFGGSANVTSSTTDGLIGYIWGYNDAASMTETVIWTGAPSEWTIPDFGSLVLPVNFSTPNASNVIVGRIDTDLSGAGGIVTGAGEFSVTPAGAWEIQAAAVPSIPEPSALLAGLVGLGILTARRTRRPRIPGAGAASEAD